MTNQKKYLADFWASACGLKQGREYCVTWNGLSLYLIFRGVTNNGDILFSGCYGPITLPFMAGWTMKRCK